jgi:hypothetical protein
MCEKIKVNEQGIKMVFVNGFGKCYYAESLKEMPTGGRGMRYEGSSDCYDVYATDEYGINKYTFGDSVELWCCK